MAEASGGGEVGEDGGGVVGLFYFSLRIRRLFFTVGTGKSVPGNRGFTRFTTFVQKLIINSLRSKIIIIRTHSRTTFCLLFFFFSFSFWLYSSNILLIIIKWQLKDCPLKKKKNKFCWCDNLKFVM